MYDVIDLAYYVAYVITHNYEHSSINTRKLNSLLYFIQGFYMKYFNKPCFLDDILVYASGPYIAKVIHETNWNVAYLEYRTIRYYDSETDTIKKRHVSIDKIKNIKKDEQVLIDLIIYIFNKFSSEKLANIAKNTPPIKKIKNTDKKIDTSDMMHYFQSVEVDIYN